MFFSKVVHSLDKHHVPYAIVGGYALMLHKIPRGTIDIDIVIQISDKNLKNCELALLNIGLSSRLPITAQDMNLYREEYIKNKNLIAWSFVNIRNPSEIVDIIITHDLNPKNVQKIKISQALKVNVLNIDSLIEMKKLSGRPQDLEDIKALTFIKKSQP